MSNQQRVLDPKSFIDAMRGLRVRDRDNIQLHFLDDQKSVVKIKNVIVSGPVSVSRGTPLKYAIEFHDIELTDQFQIENHNIQGISIYGGSFKDILIKGVSLSGELVFGQGAKFNNVRLEESRFNEGVDFAGASLNDLFVKGGKFLRLRFLIGHFGSVHISPNTIIHEVFEIEGGTYRRFTIGGDFYCLRITGGEFEELFQVAGSRFVDDISISGGVFHGKCNFAKVELSGPMRISGGRFNNELGIGGEFRESFAIENGDFRTVRILDGNFQNFLVSNGTFKGVFSIQNGKYNQPVRFLGGQFHDFLFIWNGHFSEKMTFDGGIFFDGIEINGGEFKSIDFEHPKLLINDLQLNIKIGFEIRIKAPKINRLFIQNLLAVEGRIYIKDLVLNQLKISNFENESKISVSNVQAGGKWENVKDYERNDQESSLTFKNSDLGNISFFGFDFMSFDNIRISDSRLSDIKTITGHIPVSSEKLIDVGEDPNLDRLFPEELYNQLYLAMQKQGNRTREVMYYSEYLEMHRRNTYRKISGGLTHRVFKSDWYTPFSLWVHKVTSSYGTNWSKAAVGALVIGLAGYLVYVASLPGVKWGFEYFNILDLGKSFKYYSRYFWLFMIPTHSFQLIPDYPPGSLGIFIDFLWRIFISLMLYQTVSAFRRFGRR